MAKVFFFDSTLAAGGAERVLSILSKSFASHYEEVVYLTWKDVPDFYQIDSRVKRVCVQRECRMHSLIGMLMWFRQYIIREQPDIIVSFLAPFNVMVSLVLMGTKIPIIVCERNDPNHVWNSFWQRHLRSYAYSRAIGILEQTENNKAYFTGNLLKKTDVIYNPVLMDDSYIGKALRTRKEKRIVSVARLTKQKNPEMLLEAFAEFLKSHPDYTLTMYGEGPYRVIVEKKIIELGIQEHVEMPGAVNHVWDKLADSRCFVLSSFYEGMPNALLEAMCLGLPCISTKVSGAVDLVTSGENGILVDINDVKSMSSAMCTIIENVDLAEKIGHSATHLYDKLNIEIISRQWIDYIDSKVEKS